MHIRTRREHLDSFIAQYAQALGYGMGWVTCIVIGLLLVRWITA